MDGDFIRKRLSDLRIQKGVSEYKMSLDLGHSKGYVQSISSGRAMPSMAEFLYICDYFGISPGEFFNTESEQPALTAELAQKSSRLKAEDVRALIYLAERLGSSNELPV